MNHEIQSNPSHEMKSSYRMFGGMIITSMIAMYALMYLNTYELSHVRWSETRFYMTLIMGATMAVIMLTFMRNMYKNKKLNLAIYVGSLLVFLVSLFLVRSQTLVTDSSYMSGMIPHHSIAILTSENAQIKDLRVRELADKIIEAQRREIKEMDWLISDIAENGLASTPTEADARPVPDFDAE
ncbi:DUF305 domain-containing protein [Anaerolineales bacterium]